MNEWFQAVDVNGRPYWYTNEGQYSATPPVPTAPSGGGNPLDLVSMRATYYNELNDPQVRDRLYALTHREVGGQGPEAQQAFMESVFNRAASRNKTLRETITDPNYYPEVSRKLVQLAPADEFRYEQLASKVAGSGSNISGLATGNASGTVGFGGGPTTYSANGERFGIEKADERWARSLMSGIPQQPYSGDVPPYKPVGEPEGANVPVPPDTSTADAIGAGFGAFSKAIQKQAAQQQAVAQAGMSAAIANVPTGYSTAGEDPWRYLREAGLI